MASKIPSLTDGKSGLKVSLYSLTPPAAKNDKQKRQLLLHTAGADVQDVFHTFTETGTDYITAVDKLNQDFKKEHVIQLSHFSTRKTEGR